MPDEVMWKEFRQIVDHNQIKWMIWEGEPLPEVVGELQRLGVGSIVFDPCGNLPESGDFWSVMRQNVASLKRVFSD